MKRFLLGLCGVFALVGCTEPEQPVDWEARIVFEESALEERIESTGQGNWFVLQPTGIATDAHYRMEATLRIEPEHAQDFAVGLVLGGTQEAYLVYEITAEGMFQFTDMGETQAMRLVRPRALKQLSPQAGKPMRMVVENADNALFFYVDDVLLYTLRYGLPMKGDQFGLRLRGKGAVVLEQWKLSELEQPAIEQGLY